VKEKITDIIKASSDAITAGASSVSTVVSSASKSTLEAGKHVGQAAGKVVTTTAELVGDLNGDGKVDIEDAKIAMAKAKQVAASVAEESGKLGKEVMQSELVKDVAPYAAIGAAIAVPVPIIGPAIGAAAGAALGLYKNATKKK